MDEIKKIKVIHIVQSPGGVERYLYMLFKYMKDKWCENILICSEDYKGRKILDLVDDYKIVSMTREINIIEDLAAILKIRKIIKDYNPDIVYMHSSKAGALGRIANLRIPNISIYNSHGWAFNMKCNGMKIKLYSLIERLLSPLCTEIVTISDFEKESAINRKICPPQKINVIYNGIDFDEYNHLDVNRRMLDIPEDAFVIGTVGRLTNQKSPDIFIKAAVLIKKAVPNSFFVIVGEGELRDEIENLINQYELNEAVLITGWVENPIEYINAFDIAMLLSRWEGFGLVLAEYMYANKPIIATEVDAIPNIIKDKNNGILVPMDDIQGILESVCSLIKDNNFKDNLVRNARYDVEKRFDFRRVAVQTFEMYERLYNKNKFINKKKIFKGG